jgi:hypothetical protein
MYLKNGTGANKILREQTKKIKGDVEIPGITGYLPNQDYTAEASFPKKDANVERSLLRSSSDRVSKGGGKRYIGIFALEETSIDEQAVRQRIAYDKRYDEVYDRQENACGHHVERVYTGKIIGGKNLQTQQAFMNTVIEVIQDKDSILTENFIEIASQSGLARQAEEIGEEYTLQKKQAQQATNNDDEQNSFTLGK